MNSFHQNINVYNSTAILIAKQIGALRYPKWWPFAEISPTWFILMLLWPFVAQRLINAIQRKKWPHTQSIVMIHDDDDNASNKQQQQEQLKRLLDRNRHTDTQQWKFTCSNTNNNNNNIHCLQGRRHRCRTRR